MGQQYAVVDGIRYGYVDDTAFVAERNGEVTYSGDIVIPAKVTINGNIYTVTSIGTNAFKECRDLTSVIIPEGVTTIKNYSFSECSGLTSITIPESVTTISSVAFSGCSGLTSITIPKNVTKIGSYAFDGCSGLVSIIVETGNQNYDSRNNCNAIIETATNKLFAGCKNTFIPNGVTTIVNGAFGGCSGLTSIIIPESITSIGQYAFGDCTALTSITILGNLTKIADLTFSGCSGLTSITIPESVTSIGQQAFENCSALTSITISQNVTKIGFMAFRGCSSLTSITIPESVISVGQQAFEGCTGLTSVILQTSIGNLQFAGCTSLTSITITEDVTYIGGSAFFGCTSLTSVFIPKTIIVIEPSAFEGCSGLTTIEVASDNTKYDSRNNCNAIIETATNNLVVGCKNTVIPNDVTSIGSNAFKNRRGLSLITIPGNVTSIGNDAFYDCRDLSSITMQEGVTSIGIESFGWCSNLASIAIPQSVTTINSYAFVGCTGLKSITIQEGVTSIGGNAFSRCDNLLQLSCSAITPPTIETTTFKYFDATLYVLCDAYEAYKNHEVWGQFKNIECRSLNASDIEDIAINDGEALPIIDLSEYFSSDDGEIVFSAKSSDNRVVYPVVMGNRLGFVQYGTGKAEITVTATVEPLSRSRSFTLSINTETQPQDCELSLSAKITQPKCYGSEDGKIELTVIGGTEPYYYKWSNGRTDGTLSGVCSGTYSVLVADENGCTAEKSFTIAETDSITITETLTKPTCRKSNGKITLNITGGTEPYSYLWNLPKNRIDVAKDLENLQSESYIITVTDKNSCKASKTINLPDNGAPTVKLKSVEPSKCLEATGSIEVEVSGGSSYSWSDSSNVNSLIRPKLFPGNYTFKVSDNNGCRATMLVTVPMQQFRQPEISLVSYGDTAGHNLVIWQKEQTDEIEKYFVFRESNQAGDYDRIGSLAYNETSIYVDETANFNATSCRYRISAANQCGESQLSYAYRTMRLQRKRVDGGLLLWWNSYEGFEFVKYTLYRLTNEGLEKYVELPANKYRYVVKELDPNTIGFFVTVELTEIVDVNKPMKAEGGPFAIAFSNLAEVENADAIEVVPENPSFIFSKNKTIFISNAGENNIFVCDMTGKIIAQRQKVNSAEIHVKLAGVYLVIVGDKVFKVVVE